MNILCQAGQPSIQTGLPNALALQTKYYLLSGIQGTNKNKRLVVIFE